jgi:chromosome partition protein MukF
VSYPGDDLDQTLASLAGRRVALELGTLELCFLVALHVRARAGQLASFSENELEDVFASVAPLVQKGDEKRRAGAAIQKLRNQRLLARVDGQGVVRTGEYALSRLATGIVEFFLEEDVLTRESLTLLTATLAATLAEIVEAARRGGDWQAAVAAPLRVTIGDLVAGIERRQRGLDLQQEDFQAQIRSLLDADWFGAIDRCQALLESTSATLRELNEVLLRGTSQLLSLLQDILELAIAAGASDAEAAALRLIDQVDRIAAWGAARQRAWSEYFQYVHRYLRDVVRLDPARALTQRLRDQLAGEAGRSFALAVAAAPPLRLLRAVAPVREPKPVARPRAQREREPVDDDAIDPQQILDDRVRAALGDGAVALSTVTGAVAAESPEGERFVVAGRVAQTVARLARPRIARERPWVPATDEIVIEDWAVEPGDT